MQKIRSISIIALITLILTGCADIYKAPNLKSTIANHKIIAILPFTVSIKKLSGGNLQMLQEMERKEGYAIQNECQSILLSKMSNYTVEFQDVAKTNALLEKRGIRYEDLRLKEKSELAKILGVDAIFSGTVNRQQPMSTVGAIAIEVFTKTKVATNKVDINATIHNGADSKLLWQYNHRVEGGVGSSAEELSRSLMQSISRKFPYKR